MKKKLLVPLIIGAMGVLPISSAVAYVGDLNNYTLNFSDASSVNGGAAVPDLTNVDDWEFTAFSVIGFQDVDNSGDISQFDTFNDYIIVKVKGFTDLISNDITPSGYGTSFEITSIVEGTGIQTTDNSYALTAFQQFDFIFDSGTAFTAATNSLDGSTGSTYTDGLLVEQGNLLVGGGINTGPVLPDGEISHVAALIDVLSTQQCGAVACDPFELDYLDNTGAPISVTDLLVGLTDANNNAFYSSLDSGGALPNIQSQSYIATVDNIFSGLTCQDPTAVIDLTCSNGIADFDFFFATKSEGSFNKAAIPEPASLALLGIGLIGFGAARRRRSKAI